MPFPLPGGVTLDETFGAVFVGFIFEVLLFGIATAQIYRYFAIAHRDNVLMKLSVALLWVTLVVHTSVLAHTVYYYLITSFGAILGLNTIVWSFKADTLMIGGIIILVQNMFIQALWKPLVASGWKFLALFLGVFLVAASATFLYSAIKITPYAMFLLLSAHVLKAIYVPFILAGVFNVLIAIAVWRSMGHGFVHHSGFISRTAILVVGSSIIPAILSIASVVVYVRQPHTMRFLGIQVMLPELGAVCLLTMLNLRQTEAERQTVDVTVPGEKETSPYSSPASKAKTYSREGLDQHV